MKTGASARPREETTTRHEAGIIRFAVASAVCCLVLGASATSLVGAPSAWDAFPGRNGEIVFSSVPVLGPTHLYLMRADGSRQRQLTRARRDFASQGTWSPNGKWIAFTNTDLKDTPHTYVIRPDGTGRRQITAGRWGAWAPAWSPDGRRLVFTAVAPTAPPGLWVINVNGTGLRRLTDIGLHPAWSPDGTTIAYTRPHTVERGKAPSSELWLMNADGTNNRRLMGPPRRHHSAPDWSPDGNEIVFQGRFRQGSDIYAIHPDGSGLRTLTTERGSHEQPAWSPDGTRIAFVSVRRGKRDIYVMNADGSRKRRLTTGRRSNDHPDWQPLR